MRVCVNPYTGQMMDLDAVPTQAGGAKYCPSTGRPLNHAAVELYSYPGPAGDREAWAKDATAVVDALEAQASEPNAATLGIPHVHADTLARAVERAESAAAQASSSASSAMSSANNAHAAAEKVAAGQAART